jgi:DNA-binding XRE family transcriptional regulator
MSKKASGLSAKLTNRRGERKLIKKVRRFLPQPEDLAVALDVDLTTAQTWLRERRPVGASYDQIRRLRLTVGLGEAATLYLDDRDAIRRWLLTTQEQLLTLSLAQMVSKFDGVWAQFTAKTQPPVPAPAAVTSEEVPPPLTEEELETALAYWSDTPEGEEWSEEGDPDYDPTEDLPLALPENGEETQDFRSAFLARRKEAHLTQRQVAELFNTTAGSISALERGLRGPTSDELAWAAEVTLV